MQEKSFKKVSKSLDNIGYQCYNYIIKKGGMQMDKQVGKLIKVVRALTQLALEIGTLIAVIKMIIESIR